MKIRLFLVVVLVAVLLAGFSFPGTANAGASFCHVVRPGETLAKIAAQYGVTVQALVNYNHLSNPNLIYVGQCIYIPTSGPVCGACSVTHVVKRGEYLKQIAAKYGSSWQCIAQANGLSNPNLIYPGQRLRVPVRCTGPKPPTPPPSGAWTGNYWNNPYLSGNPTWTTHPSSINFNWGQKGPGDNIPGTNFSARYTVSQYFNPGRYRFRILVDDGVRFWLDGILLIDQWHETAPVEYATENQLSAGNHSLQVDYFQRTGGAQIRLTIETINGQKAWKCDYFNNTNLQGAPLTTQYYDALTANWGNKAPAPGVTADYFSARCTGSFGFSGGKYQFAATVDDGVKVFLDDRAIIDQWHLSPPTTYTADVDVSAGTHTIKVEYFENNGTAQLKLLWTQR